MSSWKEWAPGHTRTREVGRHTGEQMGVPILPPETRDRVWAARRNSEGRGKRIQAVREKFMEVHGRRPSRNEQRLIEQMVDGKIQPETPEAESARLIEPVEATIVKPKRRRRQMP